MSSLSQDLVAFLLSDLSPAFLVDLDNTQVHALQASNGAFISVPEDDSFRKRGLLCVQWSRNGSSPVLVSGVQFVHYATLQHSALLAATGAQETALSVISRLTQVIVLAKASISIQSIDNSLETA
jgi:hypothetical protein